MSQNVVVAGPINVTLKGEITGADGRKTKVDGIPLQWAQIAFSSLSFNGENHVTNTAIYGVLAPSLPTTNYLQIVETGSDVVTNSFLILDYDTLLLSEPQRFKTGFNTSVAIPQGETTRLVDTYIGSGISARNGFPNLLVDSKFQIKESSGAVRLISANVSGVWEAGGSVFDGKLLPVNSK